MLILLGILIALYNFSVNYIKNEPLKSYVDITIKSVNNFLITIKDSSSYNILGRLSVWSSKVTLIFFVISSLLLILLPQKAVEIFFPFIVGLFLAPHLINFSVEWKQDHKDSVIEYYFSITGLIFLFAPLIIFLFEYIFNFTNLYSLLGFDENSFPFIDIIIFQLIWFLVIFTVTYLFNTIIAFTIYFTLSFIINILIIFIRLVSKYININIFNAIMGFIIMVLAIMKACGM